MDTDLKGREVKEPMEFSRQTSSIVQKVLEKNFPNEESSPPAKQASPPVEQQPADAASTPSPSPDPDAEADMDTLMAQYEGSHQKGALITGRVVSIGEEGVMVDIGAKADGLIPPHELNGEDDLRVGDEVEVILLKLGDEDTPALLSKRRADYEKNWRQLLEHYESGRLLEAMVKDCVKGGLVVDLGVEGFIPASQVMTKRRDLSGFVGQVLKLKIIEIDRKRNRLILSNTQALEEERARRKEETWASLEEGKIVSGVVRRLVDFGAFVDLGGVDGLLHTSDIAWRRVRHPKEVLKVGQKIEVLVLELDREKERISLGLKQLLPDPWKKAARNYRTGKLVKGTVTRILPSCAFVELEEGIEGVIPVSEISDKRVNSPEEVLQVGQEVEVKVLQVRARQRRISLSLKEAIKEKEKREYRQFMSNQRPETITLGDVFGDLLREREQQSAVKEQSADEDVPAGEEVREGEEAEESLAAAPDSGNEETTEGSINDVSVAVSPPETQADEAPSESAPESMGPSGETRIDQS